MILGKVQVLVIREGIRYIREGREGLKIY